VLEFYIYDGRGQSLMNTIDRINAKMGCESIKLASEGMNHSRKMPIDKKCANYTASWLWSD